MSMLKSSDFFLLVITSFTLLGLTLRRNIIRSVIKVYKRYYQSFVKVYQSCYQNVIQMSIIRTDDFKIGKVIYQSKSEQKIATGFSLAEFTHLPTRMVPDEHSCCFVTTVNAIAPDEELCFRLVILFFQK